MKIVCAYCDKTYGETGSPPPLGVPLDAVTTGICTDCLKLSDKRLNKIAREKKENENRN